MRVAAVDIGTNTVRLLLAEAAVDAAANAGDSRLRLSDTDRHEVITRLGEGLDSSGLLGAEPMGRALAGLSHYSTLIGGSKVAAVGGVATAATRSAANGAEFIARAAEKLGFVPRVIDGIEEARLTFLGATASLPRETTYCVIDVGGGSTEFVSGRHSPDSSVSVDIGSVRLTERIDSLDLGTLTSAREYVDRLFDRVTPPQDPASLLGSGGTFVTLAAVARGSTTAEVEAAGTVILPFTDLVATVERLWGMGPEEIAELPAVPAGRAAVLRAGAICAERAVARTGAEWVQISVSDLLDGLAMELAAEQWPGTDAPGHAG